jgi:hypothetical protein
VNVPVDHVQSRHSSSWQVAGAGIKTTLEIGAINFAAPWFHRSQSNKSISTIQIKQKDANFLTSEEMLLEFSENHGHQTPQ